MTDYTVPAGYGEAELTEKRSRFIGHVWPVETEDAAREIIADVKAKHHAARHNCWCYLLHDGPVRYADDGEPQGSAGQPMLEVFRRGGIENVVCVVTRYFGGILLGTGGLARAYSGAAKLALEAAGTAVLRRRAIVQVGCPYGLYEQLKQLVEQLDGTIDTADYAANVTVTAALPSESADVFSSRVTELSSGSVTVTITGYEDRAVPSDS